MPPEVRVVAGTWEDCARTWARPPSPLEEYGDASAESVPSCLVECLVWTVPNGSFGCSSYTGDLRAALLHLMVALRELGMEEDVQVKLKE